MVNRRKCVLGMMSAVAPGQTIGSLSRARTAAASLQNVEEVLSVHFETSEGQSFRKIAVGFDLSGTTSTITPGEATRGGDTFTLMSSNTVKDMTANKTYVRAISVPETPSAGDSPMKSGGLADMTFSITFDKVMSNPSSPGPVIDIDPCSTR